MPMKPPKILIGIVFFEHTCAVHLSPRFFFLKKRPNIRFHQQTQTTAIIPSRANRYTLLCFSTYIGACWQYLTALDRKFASWFGSWKSLFAIPYVRFWNGSEWVCYLLTFWNWAYLMLGRTWHFLLEIKPSCDQRKKPSLPFPSSLIYGRLQPHFSVYKTWSNWMSVNG